MGKALAESALALGHEVVIVSGPVEVTYPAGVKVVSVISTEEMLSASRAEFQNCDGLIGVAAPCDYRPVKIEPNKISKTGEPLLLQLVETDDVVATLGMEKKPHQWVVGFALESEDHRIRALVKLEKKSCNLMVLNGPEAMNSLENQVEMIDPQGTVIASFSGEKRSVAEGILSVIQDRLVKSEV